MTIGRLQVVEPYAIAATGGSSITSGNGNVVTDDPKEVLVGAAAGCEVFVDLGAAKDVDALFVGFTNAAAAATVAVYSTTALGTTGSVLRQAATVIRATDAKTARSSILLRPA